MTGLYSLSFTCRNDGKIFQNTQSKTRYSKMLKADYRALKWYELSLVLVTIVPGCDRSNVTKVYPAMVKTLKLDSAHMSQQQLQLSYTALPIPPISQTRPHLFLFPSEDVPSAAAQELLVCHVPVLRWEAARLTAADGGATEPPPPRAAAEVTSRRCRFSSRIPTSGKYRVAIRDFWPCECEEG